ncbi:hypothetical protein [Kurlavirus BKC-1]|nr:hypothetical protein [Kurlavirus BKC-1]
MQKFLQDDEYVSFYVSTGAPSLKEQKSRFLRKNEHLSDIKRMSNELLKIVWYHLTEEEHNIFLEDSCWREDVERFDIVTCGNGDSRYLAINDGDKFNLSLEFYCKLFDRGLFKASEYFETVEMENFGPDRALTAAYIFSEILKHARNKK